MTVLAIERVDTTVAVPAVDTRVANAAIDTTDGVGSVSAKPKKRVKGQAQVVGSHFSERM